MNTTKYLFSNPRFRGLLGAGAAIPGLLQPKPPAGNPVQTWVTVLVLIAILLPILMAVFAVIAMRFLGWLTRTPTTQDEVVYPERQLPAGVHLPAPTIWPAVLAFGVMGLTFALALRSWIVLGVAAVLFVLGLMGWIVLEARQLKRKA